MKNLYGAAFFVILILTLTASGQTFLNKLAGNWEGTLEYQDYQENKRVKLKTYLTITPAADGKSAQFVTVYDDFGKIIKDLETVKIDLTMKKYFAGETEYAIDSVAEGKIVLRGQGEDGDTVAPIRKTITFSGDALDILKETRTPWQFRNQEIFKRTSQNVLAKRTLSAAQLKEDFEIFKRVLTSLHPGIYRYQTPENLDKLFGKLADKIENPLAEAEFFKLLAEFTNQIYCGHTNLNPYNQNSLVRERLFGGKIYLPFYFKILSGKMIVTENAAPQKIVRGSEITKINGVPIKTIIETLLTATKGDGRNTLAHRINSLELIRFEAERYAFFDWYFPLFFPFENEVFNLETVDAATGKLLKFQTPAMLKAERTKEMAKRYGASPTYDDGWEFKIRDDSTAYLRISNSITWRLKTVKFKELIADAFAQIKTRNVKNLIIDLRGNNGGDTNIGFELARFLAREALPAYLNDRKLVRNVAAQPDLIKYFDVYSDELKTALQNGLPPNSYVKIGDGFFEIKSDANFPAVTPAANSFRGKTFVIADSSNASATFQFLKYAQNNRLARIVGQETGGNKQGINGDNYLFLNLPNSKIAVDVPVFYLAPLDLPQKDSGVIPDFVVKFNPDNIINNVDAELNFVLAEISKQKLNE